jgi:hypothetical protein
MNWLVGLTLATEELISREGYELKHMFFTK